MTKYLRHFWLAYPFLALKIFIFYWQTDRLDMMRVYEVPALTVLLLFGIFELCSMGRGKAGRWIFLCAIYDRDAAHVRGRRVQQLFWQIYFCQSDLSDHQSGADCGRWKCDRGGGQSRLLADTDRLSLRALVFPPAPEGRRVHFLHADAEVSSVHGSAHGSSDRDDLRLVLLRMESVQPALCAEGQPHRVFHVPYQ